MAMYSPYAGRYSLRGLSHSEISGSKLVSSSPKLFAAVHVLHRLSSPRHPPCALCSLTLSLRHASRYNAQSPTDDLTTNIASSTHTQNCSLERYVLLVTLANDRTLVKHRSRSTHSLRRPERAHTSRCSQLTLQNSLLLD